MLSLFTNKDHFNLHYTLRLYTKFEWVSRRYNSELDKVINYYQNRDRAVNNSHILARIIQLLSPTHELSNIEYLRLVEANAIYIAKQFNITSNVNKGNLHKSIFYGENSLELLLYINNFTTIEDTYNNWRTISPVRMIYTKDTDLDLYIPNGTKPFRSESISAFEIDLVTMLMQYKFWCKYRINIGYSTNPNVFVYNYILPNMLRHNLDLIIFNRFIKLFETGSCNNFAIKHPFNVMDLSKHVDIVLLDIIEKSTDTSLYLEQMINTIPTVSGAKMLDVIKLDNPYYTRQSYWAVWVSRINYIKTLISISGQSGYAKNRHHFNTLPVEIRALDNRSTDIEMNLTDATYSEFIDVVKWIKNKLGSR